ncbi:hypothetical protein CPLU01_15878 [Colletotrichum plurivorum]|uniref:Uncharacterized protein n=2 Tax=Colletotrichum orchidearum species complex TaxID=2707337 RepID=A0A8H6MSM1_9PEZI|nr:hypothetical protein CPLU01_15878 [Colletotrichum plurivorum]
MRAASLKASEEDPIGTTISLSLILLADLTECLQPGIAPFLGADGFNGHCRTFRDTPWLMGQNKPLLRYGLLSIKVHNRTLQVWFCPNDDITHANRACCGRQSVNAR